MCKCLTKKKSLFWIMPSNRKRIGFLPSEEVQNIIDKICIENKFSQSKVTGILVEEALRSLGLIRQGSSFEVSLTSFPEEIRSSNFNYLNELNEFSHLNNDLKDEISMINDYIDYKFFKKIMTNKNNLKQ